MIVQKNLEGEVVATYKTKTEAAKALGLDESTVRKGIKFNRRVLGKFTFAYEDYIPELNTTAKILIVDIETAPLRAYSWGLWQQNIYIDQIISNWFMLSWSAKWLGHEEVMNDVLIPSEVLYEDDYRITKRLWKLLDEADIIIAHHGDRFDIPKINTRFLIHNLPPPSSYKQIDTKKIAKNIFGFSSNKLEALARHFGYEGKYDTDFNLWADCMAGDSDALQRMVNYNDQDVRVLEKVYLKLRPYAKGHPNLDLYHDEEYSVCPHCGSKEISILSGKFFYTQSVKYQLYKCNSCGANSRGKKGIKYINKKRLSPIPR